MRRSLAVLALALILPAGPQGAAAQGYRLLMVEQPGCAWCRIFNRDMAPIYAVSPEGRAAPLVHVQLRGPLPDGVTLASRPVATPTFILIGPDGTELGRLAGYPGEDFFWAYLGRMFAGAGFDPAAVAAGDD